jgi:methionyl-tRNA formyltransferase
MGTSAFAVPVLVELFRNSVELIAAVTQPDRPKGRRLHLQPPPVKLKCIELGISVLQPEKIRTAAFYDQLQSMNLDLIVTASYGKILTARHLGIPKFGIINVHASLLPELRGAAPINWAIIRGQSRTGISIMKTGEGIDTGPVLAQEIVKIEPGETAGTLEPKLALAGARLLVEILPDIISERILPASQDENQATYAPQLTPGVCMIDWQRDAVSIDRLVRGLSPEPGAFTFCRDNRIKIYEARVHAGLEAQSEAGTIIEITKGSGMLVQTGCGILECLEVQPASKSRMRGDQLIGGRHCRIGDALRQRTQQEMR